MAAPTHAANVKKALANPEPSTHGTIRGHGGMARASAHQMLKRLAFRISSNGAIGVAKDDRERAQLSGPCSHIRSYLVAREDSEAVIG